ncbi:MAG TPA: DUF222 domain-containing protein [Candidatus Sulfotelmatobacter sp.]|nr:DUF222 domain-containing protein [Candidatus Sulfotelmatobacter sp.]
MLQPSENFAPEVAILAQAVERFCLAEHRAAGHDLTHDLPEVSRCLNLLQLKFSEMAAAFAQTDEYDSQGWCSPIHWIRVNCHMGSGAAGDRVAVGEQIQNLPETAESMASGEIGFSHVALIAREAEALALSGSNNQLDETPLLQKAREYTVNRFRNFCHHQRHALDPAAYAADQARLVEARSLSLKTGDGGMLWIRGVLDPEGGNILRTALEPLAHLNGKGDDRTHDRRLADAIVEMASRTLDGGSLPIRGGQRPHLQVTATLETLLQHCGAPAADIEFSLPISSAAVERLACDCNITRILLDSDSRVIDVGRSKRVIQPAQRRALRVRDKTCRWPGCDRPASYTSGHHLVHWIKRGLTDLANLVLLCHRHHWMVHEGKWQLVKTDDGQLLAVPPQLELFRYLARGPDTSVA